MYCIEIVIDHNCHKLYQVMCIATLDRKSSWIYEYSFPLPPPKKKRSTRLLDRTLVRYTALYFATLQAGIVAPPPKIFYATRKQARRFVCTTVVSRASPYFSMGVGWGGGARALTPPPWRNTGWHTTQPKISRVDQNRWKIFPKHHRWNAWITNRKVICFYIVRYRKAISKCTKTLTIQ